MGLHVTVLADDPSAEARWARELERVCEPLPGLSIGLASGEAPGARGQIVFVDGLMPELAPTLQSISRAGRAIFLIASEASDAARNEERMRCWGELIASGKADDALVFPFRKLEAQSKLRHYQQILMWEEVSRLNASFSGIIERLQEDLKLAERLQKTKTPARFPEIKGFRIASRYLAGMRSGGDHFDLAEPQGAGQLSIVLADSSSYGLSSALLSALMRVAVKLSAEETRSCEQTVRRIHQEIALTLGEKDRLSLFYGVISRKDYVLRYVNLGASSAFYAPAGQAFRPLASQGPAIGLNGPGLPEKDFEAELRLAPGGRLALVSDGFLESLGGEAAVVDALEGFREAEAADLLNELVFRVKSGLQEEDGLPAQDCTAALFDVDARVLRKL